jgi:hypothetical protein
MKANKANVNSSRLKIITVGDASRDLILAESGATIIITAEATADRTITLPALTGVSGTNGAFYRIIWGVASDNFDTIIKSASSSELIKGTAIYYLSGTADNTNSMANVQANGTGHYILTVNLEIEPGSTIELVTDGSHWYISNCRLAVTADPAFS